MEAFLNQCVTGLTTGCAYALLGVALVIVYRTTNHINFAQGEMATLTTYVAWALLQSGVPYWLALLLTVAGAFVFAAALERWVISRLAAASPLPTLAAFIGLFMIFHSLTGYFWGYDVRQFPSPFPAGSVAGEFVSGHQLGVGLSTAALLTMLWMFFRFTRIGLSIRAAAQNPASARLSGISTVAMAAIGWGLAAAMGGVAGMLVAPQLYLDPHMMSGELIYGFAAALMGGIYSVPGAVVGGPVLIVGMLVLRWAGLLGVSSAKRV